uniref:uncharacterized protein LOC124071079 n=1 Tax=Scatophagus argus TaxID=75038 RepID=UPI001ED84486|nr:uncharacterized protein LOC124071079 [Scatophagus argus]
MISIYIIILVPAVLAKESMECNLSGSIGAQQCFGALGKPLIFHLPINGTKTILKNKTHTILNAVVNSHGEYISQSALSANGTFMLNAARRTDSGDYQLKAYTTEGKLLRDINMHLEIQAPVSKPAVSQTCLSPEQMIIRCSSEGDEVEFTLTLDGLLPVQTRGHSQSQTNWTANMKPLAGSEAEHKASSSKVTISLHGQLTGSLKCHVGNKVSRDETVVHLTSCEGSANQGILFIFIDLLIYFMS